jgi:hypothetical protein
MTLKRLFCAVAFLTPLLVCGVALAQSDTPPSPPLTPDGEAAMDDPALVAGCLQRAIDLGDKLRKAPDSGGYFDWQLGVPLITHSDDWGVICRVDFIMAGADVAPRINRLVMYNTGNRNDVMIAIGQEVAPLASLDQATAPSQ